MRKLGKPLRCWSSPGTTQPKNYQPFHVALSSASPPASGLPGGSAEVGRVCTGVETESRVTPPGQAPGRQGNRRKGRAPNSDKTRKSGCSFPTGALPAAKNTPTGNEYHCNARGVKTHQVFAELLVRDLFGLGGRRSGRGLGGSVLFCAMAGMAFVCTPLCPRPSPR